MARDDILRLALGVALSLGVGVVQSTLLYRAGPLHPDLVLLLVMGWSMSRGVEEGVVLGLVGGFVLDSLSAVPFGVHLIGMGLIAFLTGLAESSLFRGNLLISLSSTFFFTLGLHTFILLCLEAAGWTVSWVRAAGVVLPSAVANVALAAIVYPLLGRLLQSPRDQSSLR